MKNRSLRCSIWTLVLLCMMSYARSALADPVWHCSRNHIQIADASDDFTLASLSLEREIIRISLRDLYSVYQGTLVRMSGNLPLAACVMTNPTEPTNTALQTIGISSASINALIKQQSISKTNIHLVKDEASMLACISKNHPAIGYLSVSTHTEDVGPCF